MSPCMISNSAPTPGNRAWPSLLSSLAFLGLAALLPSNPAHAEDGLGLQAETIAAGRFAYVTSLQIGNVGNEIESVREISADAVDGRRSLRIETTTVTGMGETIDLLQVDAVSLRPITRLIVQGEGRLELSYESDRVTGMIQAAGQLISVDLALAEPAYAGDAGLDTLLGGLPLREGLSGELRAIETDVDVYVQVFSFSVDDAETIETPAGSFESWPVRLQAIDDPDYRQTIWLSTATPRVFVQAEAPIPQEAGGGVLRTQLVDLQLAE